ncbi:hypothetical protein MA16_Dca000697 [Dendrobium catenatum]|uniref:Uncharacterized protein n=1 Tax=Dendrobium catenatum TaxID=906689 RepID=A0A2I0WUL0_9ASPA|nr:hypothetical protein MA16_Dca000697 [Dendrobium catenatum]
MLEASTRFAGSDSAQSVGESTGFRGSFDRYNVSGISVEFSVFPFFFVEVSTAADGSSKPVTNNGSF